jgi:hypothetical protein
MLPLLALQEGVQQRGFCLRRGRRRLVRLDPGEDLLTRYQSAPGWGLCFCRICGTTLCGLFFDTVHGVTLGSVDDDPGVQIGTHIFVGSKASWDHIGGSAPQYAELPP